jgi:hypothetical protein
MAATSRANLYRIIGWGGAAALLLVPLITRAPWTAFDYVVAGGLMAAIGIVIEFAVRTSGSLFYRAGAALAALSVVMLFLVNGAVGFLGDEGNPANLVFVVVMAIAVLGCVIAQFRSAGMAWVMFATAAAQVIVGVVALAAGWASPGNAGLYEVTMGTAMFTTMWVVAGALFRRAASERAAAAS